jgi:zinc protease
MLRRIRELYEPVPGGKPEPPRLARSEPAQAGERRVFVEGPGETVYIQVAHHVPEATHPDFFPLMALDSLLTGPSNLNMFGSGISNKTSRLYRALVEKELAVTVHGGLQASIDPFMHTITTIVHPQRTADEVLEALYEEIGRLDKALPSPDELARAVKQARALFAYGTESITNQAFWMGFAEMFASYDWFLGYLDSLAAVTPEDVQRVARTYFRPRNRIVGIYVPTEDHSEVSS